MLTVNGTYNLNGKSVYLTFNQSHDGTFGAITSGLSEARSSGIAESRRDSIPTDSGATSTQQSQTTNVNSNDPYEGLSSIFNRPSTEVETYHHDNSNTGRVVGQ